MEDENRKKGIFFGIIGVATLIIAIIGATFAYFTATAGSANNAVDITSFDFSASVSVNKEFPSSVSNLIPVLTRTIPEGQSVEQDTGKLVALLNKASDKCIDENGFAACALYHITVTNTGINALTLEGKIVTTDGGQFANLEAQFVTYDETEQEYALDGDAIAINETAGASTTLTNPETGSDGVFTVAAQTETGGTPRPGTTDFYLVIYLNDTGEAQPDEMGQTYTGQIVFENTNGTGGQLTAQITV